MHRFLGKAFLDANAHAQPRVNCVIEALGAFKAIFPRKDVSEKPS